MEYHVSPLIKPLHTDIPKKLYFDDPYAYVTKMDPLTRHEYNYILGKIENGWITARDIDIVQFLFVHRWVTLSQLSRIFFPDIERVKTIRARVNKMIKYGLIRRVQWSSRSDSTEIRPSYYELGSSGADILKFQYGIFLGHRDPRNPKPSTMLYRLKYIATNELYIHLRNHFNLTHFEFHPILKLDDDQQIPTAKFSMLNPRGSTMNFYLICHREDEKWAKTLMYQAHFFKKYLVNHPKCILIIFLSSDEKADIAQKILGLENILDKVWFITDEDLIHKNIEISNCFFGYQDGKKVYYDLS